MSRPSRIQVPERDQCDDGRLLDRLRRGDEAAFGELYESVGIAVYRYALKMSGDSTFAEEVVQETFLSVIQRPRNFDPSRGRIQSYLFGIARNRTLRRVESEVRFESVDCDALEDCEPSALEAMTLAERVEAVRGAVLSLPGVYREAVVLCDLEEMSYQQAAEASGVALGTIRSRLNRGRALLQRKLETAALQEAPR